MAEKVQENGLDTGSDGNTNPNASTDTGAQTSQAEANQQVEQLLQRLEPLISERVEKAVQSTKDKRFNEQERFRRQYEPVLEKFKGLIPDEQLSGIQRDLELDDLRGAVERLQSGQVSPGKVEPGSPVDMAKLVGDIQLDMSDPQAKILLNRRFDSETEAKAAIADYLIAKNQAPSPTRGQAPADNSGEKPNRATVDSLMQDYQKEVAQHRGNVWQVSQIQDKYRKKAAEAGLTLNL